MVTPTGLPQRGDIVEVNGRKARVVQRTSGSYWSMTVEWLDNRTELSQQPKGTKQLLVDCAYWMQNGHLKVVKS